MLSVLKITQTDLNEFDIQYSIQVQPAIKVAEVGIVTQIKSDPTTKKHTTLIKNPGSSPSLHYKLANLEGSKTYEVSLYAIMNSDTVYSKSNSVTTSSLQIISFKNDIVLTRRLTGAVKTNIPYTSNVSNISLSINQINCNIITVVEGHVVFEVPEQTPSGLVKILLRRNSLEATLDSVQVLFGHAKTLSDFPVPPGSNNANNYRIERGAFSHADKGYIFGGSFHRSIPDENGEPTHQPNHFLEYNSATQTWSTIPYDDNLFIRNPQIVTVNGVAYMIGGYVDTLPDVTVLTYLKHTHQFDRAQRRFIPLAPIPWEMVRDRNISFTVNNKIYVGLGEGGNMRQRKLFNDLWEYDPDQNKWQQKNNFPGQLRANAVTFVVDNYVYMVGGRLLGSDGFLTTEETDELWRYDPLADSWTEINYDRTRGPGKFFGATSLSHDGYGYILGGFKRMVSPAGYIYVTIPNYRYNPIENSFETIVSGASGTVIHNEGNKFILAYQGLIGDQSHYSKSIYELILE